MNDEMRRATFDAYVEFHGLIERSYLKLGYRLVVVPKADVSARADFVQREAGSFRAGGTR